MKKIPPRAIAWQENHKNNGNGITNNNEQQKEHDNEKKFQVLNFNNLPSLALNETPNLNQN
jgi:hypothetical protein